MYMSKACKFISIFLGNQGSPKTPPYPRLKYPPPKKKEKRERSSGPVG